MCLRSDFVPELSDEEWRALPALEVAHPLHGPGTVKIDWSDDWYDGPLSGMCTFDERRFYFFLVNVAEDSTRTYALFELSAQQLVDEEYWHQEFLKNVTERRQDSMEEWRRNFYDRHEKAEFEPCAKTQAKYRFAW